MKTKKTASSHAERLQVKLPAGKIIYLEDLIRLLPISVQRTSLWEFLLGHSGCRCCCSRGGAGSHSHASSAPVASPSAPTGPASSNASVTFTVSIRQFIVGSSLAVEANFNWAAIGAPGLTVNVQVKSGVTFTNWTNVLTSQPPVDIGTWPVSGVPRETFHFRAVAMDAQGNAAAYSQIITI